ncbi:ComEC/Rec2 family competence protein [Actinokineospora fastidiosa]|uniref:Competence protein ComEC n=1 Tax=Actinokineospora fastidiosa TaxID=1816 RepID=A0A918GKE6_9PSEU|nr:ComEC/Rec2 family competence protein [Actinokineospora fastidiosa]GGS41781.1 competence protein ComEC [Actinokineospora fastidiosa]
MVPASHDWRLVPAAGVVWGAAFLGLLVHWAAAAAVGVVAVGVAATVIARARGGVYAAWPLLAAGVLAVVPVAERVRGAGGDPLRAMAAAEVDVVIRIEVAERPRPIRSAGYAGTPAGVRSVVIAARAVPTPAVPSGGVVVVFAPAERWGRLLPGQQATAQARLAPAPSGDLTVATVNVRGPPSDVDEPDAAQRIAGELRAGLRETAAAVLGPEAAGLLPALVVGDTDGLPPGVRADFDTAGMTHLLAVSGANLAIVGFFALFLLRLLRAGPWTASGGAAAAMVGFVVLAGPEPSVLRAAVMGVIGLLALALGREKSTLPALAVAVVGLVAVDPAMAVSFGFVLSVLATTGLVLIAPRWAVALQRRRVPPGIAEALAVPAAAHLVTAPVVAGMSGQVSLVAVVANLVAAPVVAPATVLGVVAALVVPVWSGAAEVLVAAAGPETEWLIAVADHAAAVPGAAVPWPDGWWGGLAAAVAACVLVLAVRLPRTRALVALGLVGALLVVIPVRVVLPGWPPDGWAAVFCDVGQGDGAVLATAEPGTVVVVDTGPEPGPLVECLDRLDVTRVAAVVLSHLHADHIGGLPAVLARWPPGAVVVGPGRQPGWAWDRVRDTAEGTPVVELTAGRRLAWPGLTIDVLHPKGGDAETEDADGSAINNASLVLLARTGAGRVLLTGDIELTAQADLVASGADLAAEVVKVPHHGSRFSDPAFMAAVRPRLAVVSVGARNRYGHPNPGTLAALARIGARTARTDAGGDVAVLPGPVVVSRGPP